MSEIIFEEELEKAKAKLYDGSAIAKMTIINVKRFKKYVDELSKKEKIYGEELKDKMHKEYNDMLYDYLKISGTGIVQKQVQALKTVNNNSYILDKIYEKIKDKDLTKINFEENLKKSTGKEEEFEENEISAELNWIRNESKFVSPQLIEKYKKSITEKNNEKRKMYQEEIKRKIVSKDAIKILDIFVGNTEKEKLARGLKYREKELEQFMLKEQKEQFKKAGEFLQKNNLLNIYVRMQNKDYEKMEMPGMKYTEEEVEKIFTDDYIDKLEPFQLAMLNAFWQNRFTKEAIDFGEKLFIFDTLNLWENYKKVELDEEKIKEILQKEKICDDIFYSIKDNIQEKIQEETFSYGLINLNNVSEQLKSDYKKYFDEKLPESDNILTQDLEYGQNKRNVESVVYRAKTSMVQELLLDIEHNHNITNWGYVPETRFGKNSIQKHKKHILISIDYPGFNMPLRLHLEKEVVENLINIRKNSTVIPIYEGDQDFNYRGENLTTKLFMPLTEQGESEIIKQNKNINATDSRYGYIKHLGNLITKKVKSIKKMYPTRYVDLKDGTEGIKTKDNKFIPDKPIDENDKVR